jgi:oligopeptide/dipeptide ABC transporter ATP-binding protein
MFRGKIVEQAPTELLVSEPRHPYTRRLLAAVPGGSLRNAAIGAGMEDETIETLAARRLERQSSSGCPYYPHCPLRDDECSSSAPSLRELSEGHVVSCHKMFPGRKP